MAGFAQDLLQGFVQGVTGNYGILKDYRHGAYTFRTNDYALTPRTKFLFHVYFTINQNLKASQNLFGTGNNTIGLLVKTAQLPSYQVEVDVMNQYNRKRLVQSKINYQPVVITLHDDNSDLIRNMWYSYYSYYYNDASKKYNNIPNQAGTSGQSATASNGFGYQSSDIYSPTRAVSDWGYIGETYNNSDQYNAQTPGGKPPFFTDITIYGLAQKRFAQYTMINPMISEWQHDTYDYSQGSGTIQHSMTIRYETVKYFSGAVGGQIPSLSVPGFADPANYDTQPSDITPVGATNTVFRQGGIVATSGDIQDLQSLQYGFNNTQNVLGAVQQAGVNYNTYQSASSIVNANPYQSAVPISQNSLPGGINQIQNSGGGVFFPSPPTSPVIGGGGEITNVTINSVNPGGPGGPGVGG